VKTRKKLKATDPNVIAKAILDAVIEEEKDSFAVALGKRGGLKGGRARAANTRNEGSSNSWHASYLGMVSRFTD